MGFYPVYKEQIYLDCDEVSDLDGHLDHDPDDVPVYAGHSLFNITIVFIVQSLFDGPPYI